MSDQRQDWAALRVACDNTLAGRSVDSHIDPRFVLDLLAEVDRLTEALHDAKIRLDTQTDMTAKADESAERWYDRALRLEADLADEKRRRADAVAAWERVVAAKSAAWQALERMTFDPTANHFDKRVWMQHLADLRAALLLDTATEETP